jgi:hypothetical protein
MVLLAVATAVALWGGLRLAPAAAQRPLDIVSHIPAPPNGRMALGATLYVADGKASVACVTSERFEYDPPASPKGLQEAWTSELAADGRPTSWRKSIAFETWAYGWDPAAFVFLEHESEPVVIAPQRGDSGHWVALHQGEAADRGRMLGFPTFGHPDRTEMSLPGDAVAENAGFPRAIMVGSEVWITLMETLARRVWVSHTEWGQWDVSDWSKAEAVMDQVALPDIAFDDQTGFILVAPRYIPDVGDAQGPIWLSRSDEGHEWSVPEPVNSGIEASWVAAAVDDEVGLVLVYHALYGDGMPLYAVRSRDFGETWGRPVRLTATDSVTSSVDALIHDGRLHLCYRTLAPSTLQGTVWPPISSARYTGIESVRVLAMDVLDLPAP